MWQHSDMRASIDSAGRIVVPKALRDALGVRPGQELDVHLIDGRLVIEVAATTMRLKRRRKALTAVPLPKLPPLTADQVRETLDAIRR
jgi:AbrB family looped-hinge helix DNA binding protein